MTNFIVVMLIQHRDGDAEYFGATQYFENDDLIVMELNCKRKSLNYCINNKKDKSFGFKNITFNPDIIYHLAVGFHLENDSVQLVKYESVSC